MKLRSQSVAGSKESLGNVLFKRVKKILHGNLVSGAADARDLLDGPGLWFVGGTLGQRRAGIGHSGAVGDADRVRGRGRGGDGGQRLDAVGPRTERLQRDRLILGRLSPSSSSSHPAGPAPCVSVSRVSAGRRGRLPHEPVLHLCGGCAGVGQRFPERRRVGRARGLRVRAGRGVRGAGAVRVGVVRRGAGVARRFIGGVVVVVVMVVMVGGVVGDFSVSRGGLGLRGRGGGGGGAL